MKKQLLKILVVEDDKEDYLITSGEINGMKRVEAESFWAKSCKDGVEKLKCNKYDLILIDYYLGDKTGLDFAEGIRGIGIKTPAILLTGGIVGDDDLEFSKFDTYDYIEKENLSSEYLERSIRYTMDRYRLQKEITEQKELLDLIFDTLPVGIALVDNDGKIKKNNNSFLKIIGASEKEIWKDGHDFEKIISFYKSSSDVYEDSEYIDDVSDEIILGNNAIFEGILESSYGKKINSIIKTDSIEYTNGKARKYTLVVIIDIDKQKITEKKLCQTIEKTKEIIKKHAIDNVDINIIMDLTDLELDKIQNNF